jgi:hypothetical protein
MHPIPVRILKQGIPVALILAAVGFLMAEAAGIFFAMQSGGDSSVRVTVGDAPASADAGEDLTRTLQRRLPFTLAAWGFGLVVALELLLGLWRGRKPATPSSSAPTVPTEDETEKLLNQLLQQADAAEADRAKSATDTPPPGTPCPTPAASENSRVNN